MSVRSLVLALPVTAVALVVQTMVTVPTGIAPADATPAPRDAAAATQTWGPVKTIAGNPRGESIVVDALNNTTIVWGTSWTGSSPRSILALRRSASGRWGTPVVIGRGYAPKVAADGRGNVTVVWLTQRAGFTDGVAAARRPVGGHWSEPQRLSRDLRVPGYPNDGEETYGAAEVDLAVSPHGAAVAAWSWGSDARDKPWRIRSAYRPAGGHWGDQVDVTPASQARHPRVGIDARGTVVLVYGRQPFGHPQALKSRLRRVGAGWTQVSTVAAEGYEHSLTVDRAGNAVVVFTPNFNRVKAAYRPTGRRWRSALALSPKGVSIADYALAMNGRGTALVAMARDDGRVDLTKRPPRGPWSAPACVAGAGAVVFDVLVALNGNGDTFVGWGGYALYGKYRPHGGSWSGRFTLSPDAGVEVLEESFAEVAPRGDAVVMWKQEERPLKVRWMTP